MDLKPTAALDGTTLEWIEETSVPEERELTGDEITAALLDLEDKRMDGRSLRTGPREGAGRPRREDGGRDTSGNAIGDLSHIHEAICEHIVLYPHHTIREVAERFSYTAAWMSRIVSSDMFQKRLAELRKEHFTNLGTSVKEKLEGIAHAGLDKMARHLDVSEDPKLIKEVTKDALTMLGYGVKPSAAAVNVNGDGAQVMVVADAGTLARAREIMKNQGSSNVIPLPSSSNEPPQR